MDSSKYGSVLNIINFSWDDVVSCFWKKYPNQYSQHVLSEDVVDRKITPDGKLYSRRILSKTNPLPKWGNFIFKSHLKDMVHIVEESIVDPINKTMKVYSWNVGYRNMMDVQECMTIAQPAAETPSASATSIQRQGWVDSSLTGFRRVLRQFGLQRWKSNVNKAHLGYVTMLQGAATPLGHQAGLKECVKGAQEKARRRAIDIASIAQNIVIEKSNSARQS